MSAEPRAAAAAHARLDAFEEAWQAAPFPAIESFLADVPGNERRKLLIELLKIDLDQRWRCTSVPSDASALPARPLLEDYARYFPELGDVAQLPITLIREEYWVRHCWGDRPSLDTYLKRFAPQSAIVRNALARVEAELALEPGRDATTISPLAPGSRVGGYVLLELLGAGVTGQVFKARHEKSGTVVALKVIRPELLSSPDARRRFVQEIRATSQLSHPNVARAHDVADEAMNYLAMEYFEGVDLDRLVKRSGPLPIDLAREFIRQAALGLQHIHEHGLVHRDIKPANLLLAQVPDNDSVGRTSRSAEAPRGASTTSMPIQADREVHPTVEVIKILDLGLARLSQETDGPAYSTLTREGTVMGTPDYMAPEQAADARTADIRADIYSLGCTFYYLLAGRSPFPGGTFIQKVDRHRWETPTPIEELRQGVPLMLRAVLAKMLAKSPGDRFAAPAEVATALELGTEIIEGIGTPRLDGEATHIVSPRGITNGKASTTIARRVRGVGTRGRVLLALVACVALAVGMLLVPSQQPESKETPRPRLAAAASPFDVRIAQGVPEAQRSAGQPPEVVAVLGDSRWRQWGLVWSVAYSKDGRFVASAGEERAIRVWDPNTGGEVMALHTPNHVYAIAYSPDGRYLASGGLGHVVMLWDAASGHERRIIRRRMAVRCLAFTPDSQTLAVGTDDGVIFWDVETGKETGFWPHSNLVHGLAFSADGASLAAGGPDGRLRLYDMKDKREEAVLTVAPGVVRALAFSPKGRLLAAGGTDGTVQMWNLDHSQPEAKIVGRHISPVRTLAFSPSGKTLASGTDGEDRTILLWDTEQGRLQGVMRPRHERAHEGVFSISFAPDGRTIASGSPDGTIRVWDVATRLERSAVPPAWPVDALEVTPNGRTLAIGSRNGPGRLWDVASGAETILDVAGGSTLSAAIHPDGTRGMFGGHVGITFWDALGRRATHMQAAPGLPLVAAAYSPDGNLLATGSGDPHDRRKVGELKLWELRSGEATRLVPAHDGSVQSLAFGRVRQDGEAVVILASGGGDGVVILWDFARRSAQRRLAKHTGRVRVVAFTPDGRLATGSDDGTLRLWDAVRGTEITAALRARRGGFLSAAWSPDGSRLAACDESNAVAVWEVGSWRRLLLRDMPGPVHQVRFSPDGRYLLTGNANGTVSVLKLDGKTE
jgi:WD40 repeat protein/serine/threonine protein kinase